MPGCATSRHSWRRAGLPKTASEAWPAKLRTSSSTRTKARVAKEEEELRQHAVHGEYFDHGQSFSGYIPGERCLERLREREPVFALVREWCGAAAIERFDELVALREEVRRLRELITREAERLDASGEGQRSAWLRKQA